MEERKINFCSILSSHKRIRIPMIRETMMMRMMNTIMMHLINWRTRKYDLIKPFIFFFLRQLRNNLYIILENYVFFQNTLNIYSIKSPKFNMLHLNNFLHFRNLLHFQRKAPNLPLSLTPIDHYLIFSF